MGYFSGQAPALEYLRITHDSSISEKDIEFPGIIFGGQLPKFTSLTLVNLRTDLRNPSLSSLTQFNFTTRTEISVRNLTSFFQQCPLLEFIQIRLEYKPQLSVPPSRKRVQLAVLKELRLNEAASTSGLLDHLILPKCADMLLRGQFTDKAFDVFGDPAARIHPSSIDHLPVMRGVTKAVAMPNSCVLSGLKGHVGFWCSEENRGNFDAEFLTSFSPISISKVNELWVGASTEYRFGRIPWKQTAVGLRGAFEALKKVEDLTIVGCETGPIFAVLDVTMGAVVLLSGLRRLTIHVGWGDLDVSGLIRSAKTRKEYKYSQPLGEVTIIFENHPGADVIREVESLRMSVEELNYRVGVTPELRWDGKDCDRR